MNGWYPRNYSVANILILSDGYRFADNNLLMRSAGSSMGIFIRRYTTVSSPSCDATVYTGPRLAQALPRRRNFV